MSELNPQITDTMVGIREMKKITLFPLSLADEFKMSEVIATIIAEIATDAGEDTVLITKIVTVVKQNIKEILGYVLDKDIDVDVLMSDITNNQLIDIATIIYEVNFRDSLKNLKDLAKKFKSQKDLLTRS